MKIGHKHRSTLPNAKQAAKRLRARGLAVCRIDAATKTPTYPGCSTHSLDAADVAPDDLIGIVAGPLSHGNHEGHALNVVALDDANAVKLADKHLPKTGLLEGRPSKQRSHRYYLVPFDAIPQQEHSTAAQAAPAAIEVAGHLGPRPRSFRNPTGLEILRLIGTGGRRFARRAC